jgi:hypothetical protein
MMSSPGVIAWETGPVRMRPGSDGFGDLVVIQRLRAAAQDLERGLPRVDVAGRVLEMVAQTPSSWFSRRSRTTR